MRKEDDNNLKELYAGSSVSGTVISALGKIVGLLYDAGRGFGSSIRRVGEGNLCPLK